MADVHGTSIERLNKAALAAGFSMAPPEDAFDEAAEWHPAVPSRTNLPAVIERTRAAYPREMLNAMVAAASRLRSRLPGVGRRAPA